MYVNSTYVNDFLKKYVREWHIMKYGRIYVRELIIENNFGQKKYPPN